MTGTMSRISDGLSPASTSSSSSSFGSVASARASSSRLRPATVSVAAGSSSLSARPTSAADLARAARQRVVARPVAQMRADAMFSRTDRPAKGCTIWKVRAMPRCARLMRRLAGDVLALEQDRARRSARSKPEIMANSVVLPAPFGPIRPVIGPCRARQRSRRRRRPGRRSA